LSVLCV